MMSSVISGAVQARHVRLLTSPAVQNAVVSAGVVVLALCGWLVWHETAAERPVACALTLVTGASMVAAGRWVATSPHGSPLPGLACTLSGATWPLSWLAVTSDGVASWVGWLYGSAVWIPLIYVVTGFPKITQLRRRHRAALYSVTAFVFVPLNTAITLVSRPEWAGASPTAWWPRLLAPDATVFTVLFLAFGAGSLGIALWVLVLCAARLRTAASIDRFVRLPAVIGTSVTGLVCGTASALRVTVIDPASLPEVLTAHSAGLLAFPVTVLLSHLHLRSRRQRLLEHLTTMRTISLRDVERVLALELLDASIRVVLWDPLRRRALQHDERGVLRDATSAEASERLFADRTVAVVTAPAVAGGHLGHDDTIAFITADARLQSYGPLLDTASAALSTPLTVLVQQALIEAQRREAAVSRTRAAEADAAAEHRTRTKIRRDLHDGAQQRFFALAFRLGDLADRCEGEAVGEELAQMRDEMAEAADDLRDFAHGLADVDLRDSVLRMAQQAPFPVQVNIAELELSPVQRTNVGLAINESLTNAIKHAGASRVSIDLTRTDGSVTVVVQDDGRGGAASGIAGVGFQGLNDRLAELDGSVLVDSPPGQGTRIVLSFPATPSLS